MSATRQRIAFRINGFGRSDCVLGGPRTVVVTGAGSGIGGTGARKLGFTGAQVTLIALGNGALQAAAVEIKQPGECQTVVAGDVGDFVALHRVAYPIERQFEPVDVSVSAALPKTSCPSDQFDPSEFR